MIQRGIHLTQYSEAAMAVVGSPSGSDGQARWLLHRNENNIGITDGPLSLLLDTAFVVVVVCCLFFCLTKQTSSPVSVHLLLVLFILLQSPHPPCRYLYLPGILQSQGFVFAVSFTWKVSHQMLACFAFLSDISYHLVESCPDYSIAVAVIWYFPFSFLVCSSHSVCY